MRNPLLLLIAAAGVVLSIALWMWFTSVATFVGPAGSKLVVYAEREIDPDMIYYRCDMVVQGRVVGSAHVGCADPGTRVELRTEVLADIVLLYEAPCPDVVLFAGKPATEAWTNGVLGGGDYSSLIETARALSGRPLEYGPKTVCGESRFR